ncbi:MAG: AAA family ATPase [Desulfuromonadaceae bacterium]|nr:AAA family ATPase [Desulfuromonadaceae bacterium]
MYCEFFGFNEKPFTITPNPHFVYLSNIHREAFARLLYGVDSHAGFITLTGEVGTGKTTLLRTLMAHLDQEKYRNALILNSHLTRVQLLSNICSEFEIEVKHKNSAGYLDALNRFLLDQNIQGKTVVLVIDEAQNLKPDVLEQVRLISNLETERDKLVQIILAGQPEFDDILNRHDLRQLNQRITIRCNLSPMDFADTSEYVRHRLKLAGGRNPEIFSKEAVKKIFRFSKGFPRLINVVCEQALVMAWTEESPVVSPSMASIVIAEAQTASDDSWLWRHITAWYRKGKRRIL